jgi:hypothetical protein
MIKKLVSFLVFLPVIFSISILVIVTLSFILGPILSLFRSFI